MAIWITGQELQASMSEIVGYKSGIALSTKEMISLFEDGEDVSLLMKEGMMRLYSTDIEELLASLLFKIGNIASPSTVPISIQLFHKIKDDPKKVEKYLAVLELFTLFMKKALDTKEHIKNNKIDPSEFMNQAARHGREGVSYAVTLLDGVNHQLHISPWGKVRRQIYANALELKELFESASLEAEYGKYVDQRFIDFLDSNESSIDKMHWRKFEGLAAEFFDREGYKVEIGPGRDDGGVDIRVYKEKKESTDPAVVLVQCKKTKSKVGRAVVKALWADVVYEKAESGLIVTTSAISPGAKRDCVARGYPIEEANRDTVKEWISQMKTPSKGVFMGE
jgi:restriction system protein